MEKDPVKSFLDKITETDDNERFPLEPSRFSEEPEEIPEPVEPESKQIPYHKDEKLQRYIEKEISKRMESLEFPTSTEEKKKPLVDEDYYIRLIGNDTPEKIAMIKESMARDEKLLEIAEERALSRLSQQDKERLQAEQQAEEELTNAFENIEDTFGVDITGTNPVARKTRNDFISYVEKIAPKDRYGDIIDYPDMISAWETFSELRQRTPSRAKELASRSMTRSVDSTQQPQIRMGWDAVDDFIDGLQ